MQRLEEGPLALRIERGAISESARVEDRPALLLPLGRSIVEVDRGETSATRLDRSVFALLPARTRWRVRAVSPVTELLTLLVGEQVMRTTAREYRPHVEPPVFMQITKLPLVLTRTRWVDEVAHRYLFEREVCEKHGSAAARFLEIELAKELYFLGKEKLENRSRTSVVFEGGDVVRRAREVIEDDLFEPLQVTTLAKRIGVSASTLLRAFHRELGIAPAAYQRERRLDEAMLLLASARFSVSEIAMRVGYTSLAAFSVAFGRRFGIPPSRAKATPHPDLVPPQGRAGSRSTKSRKR
jgi:AraC-like DNA-binding protein